jgi:hypothetical protein
LVSEAGTDMLTIRKQWKREMRLNELGIWKLFA